MLQKDRSEVVAVAISMEEISVKVIRSNWRRALKNESTVSHNVLWVNLHPFFIFSKRVLVGQKSFPAGDRFFHLRSAKLLMNNSIMDDDLFGSDNEEEEVVKTEEQPPMATEDVVVSVANEAEEEVTEVKAKTSASSHEEEGDLFGSDDEEEKEEVQDGDDDNNASLSHRKDGITNEMDVPSSAPQDNELDDLFGDEGETTFSPSVIKKKTVSIAKLCLPERTKLPDPSTCIAMKMPNFVKIQTEGYDEDTHNAEAEAAAFGGIMSVIRWRVKRDADGQVMMGENGMPMKESNSRLVKLSDGSYKLLVGDATFQASLHTTEKRYAFVRSKSINPETGVDDTDMKAKTEHVFECAGIVQQHFVLRPDGVGSIVHNKMSQAIKEKYMANKSSTTEQFLLDVKMAPETDLNARAKQEEEELRKERKRKQQEREGGASYYQTSSSRFASRRPSMSAAYLNDDGDELQYDDVNITDLKKKAKSGKKASTKGRKTDDDQGDLDDFIDSEDDESVVGEYLDGDDDDDEEEEEEEEEGKKNKPTRSKKQESAYVDEGDLEDDDESDDEDFDGDNDNDEDDFDDNSEDDDDDEEPGAEGEDDDEEKEVVSKKEKKAGKKDKKKDKGDRKKSKKLGKKSKKSERTSSSSSSSSSSSAMVVPDEEGTEVVSSEKIKTTERDAKAEGDDDDVADVAMEETKATVEDALEGTTTDGVPETSSSSTKRTIEGGGDDDDDENEGAAVQLKKRPRRAVIDSDEDE